MLNNCIEKISVASRGRASKNKHQNLNYIFFAFLRKFYADQISLQRLIAVLAYLLYLQKSVCLIPGRARNAGIGSTIAMLIN